MAQHTFELWGPDDAIVSGEAGTVTSTQTQLRVRKLVTYSESLTDVVSSYAARGFVSVGAGDQRFAWLASWTPPNTSVAYVGGLLSLLDAARLTDLNDMRVKLGQAVARIGQLEAVLAERGITT